MKAETLTEINEYFNQSVDPKDFGKYMRRFIHASLSLQLRNSDNMFREEMEEGYFWLTSFVEVIDPQITK